MIRNEIYPCITKYISNVSTMINSVTLALNDDELIRFDKEHLIKVIHLKNCLKDKLGALSEK